MIEKRIAQADNDPVLIAETGGQNVLVSDSSALPEQVVADVLSSAFDSAGPLFCTTYLVITRRCCRSLL
ncbi:MAG: hypothetical protein ACLR5Y_04330 [Haemophilus parainfluenzae]